jgi:anti-sigma-K factor RskA
MSEAMRFSCEQADELAAGFVLGALEDQEMAAVRDHLAGCPQPHEDFAQLGGAVMHLAEAVEPVEPPASLKARIMAAAATDSSPAVQAPAQSAYRERIAPPRERRDPEPGRPPILHRLAPLAWAGAAMGLALVVALGAFAAISQTELQARRQFEQGVAQVLDLAARDGSRVAVLSGEQEDGPRGIAAIGADGQLRLAMHGLSPTTGDQVYEAWVIAGEAAPVPVGGFRVDTYGTGSLATAAATFEELTLALTLEPQAGATEPTMPIIALGTATEPGS